ncbi:MAG: DUF5996 family protein [Acidimicrobiales bacterium]
MNGIEGRSPDWPELTLSEWSDSRDTLVLWTQVIGKIRMALEPMLNHWWQVPLYVSSRGLTTSLMHGAGVGVEAEFNFLDQVLEVRNSEGTTSRVELEPQSVADFYAATLAAFSEVGVSVEIFAKPVELPVAIPFPEDLAKRAYDGEAIRRFWTALLQAHRLLTIFRSRFIGKASPVHFFWGAGDLATTRFSGRTAPKHPGGAPNCADWVMEIAYSHEVSSCGFWPGGSDEGSFYAYAYPQPEGFEQWKVEPESAHFDESLGEFILPYASVRKSPDPDSAVLRFLQTTYEAAADLARWDREALEANWESSGRLGE